MALTEAVDKSISIDDEIAKDWADIQARHAAENPEPEPVEAPIVEAPAAESEKVDTRARDESGKFVKAEKAPESKAEKSVPGSAQVSDPAAVPSEKAGVEAAPVPAESPGPARDINRPPSTWKPQVRGEWEKLSPNVRAEIHRREADFQNGQAQLLPDARLGSAMRQVTEPYRAMLDQAYGGPDRAMQSFLQTAGLLQMGSPQQKLQEIVRISQQFGIDLSQLSQSGNPQGQSAQQQPFQDPRVDQLLQQMRQQEQVRQNTEQSHLEGIANAWLNEVDAKGNPLRPYIADVMTEMSVLIPQIRQANPLLNHAQVLEQAYDRAVWANPDTRTALQDKQRTELLESQRAANQQRVQEARKAASVNVPRRGSTPTPAKPGSIDETLEATARELGLIS